MSRNSARPVSSRSTAAGSRRLSALTKDDSTITASSRSAGIESRRISACTGPLMTDVKPNTYTRTAMIALPIAIVRADTRAPSHAPTVIARK